MHTSKELRVRETKKVGMKDAVMIEGMPGMGNVGKISIDFMIESVKAEKIAEVYADYLSHCVFLKEDGSCELPKIEIYHKKIKKRDFIFVTGDVQPVDERGCYDLCRGLIEYFREKKGKEIVTLGGIGLGDLPKNPKVYVSSWNRKVIDSYKGKKMGLNAFNVIGPIIGVSGVLVGMAKLEGIKATTFLAETFGNPLYLGVGGAREIIKVMEENFRMGLDIKGLNREIKEVEKEIKEKIEKMVIVPGEESGVQERHATNYIG